MTAVPDDACDWGRLPAADPRSLACDYVPTHYCRNAMTWSPATQDALDAARTVAALREAWAPLEEAGQVDGLGGSEYHHALAHLRWFLEQEPS
jgi:hypothetical protein